MYDYASPIRVLIVDRYPIFVEGLRSILSSSTDFTVVGQANTGRDTVTLAKRLSPNLLILDSGLPDISGLEVLRLISDTVEHVRVLLLTSDINHFDANEAFRLGAHGILAKTAQASEVLRCLRAIAAGEYWMRHEYITDLLHNLQRTGSHHSLTEREHQVVEAILACQSNRQIALALNISEETVKSHIRNVFEKLQVSSRLELALLVNQQ